MATRNFSQSPYLPTIAKVLAVIPIGFGINAILRPGSALAVFEFEPPASAADQKLVDSLMVLYGARDIFMGIAMFATAFFGSRKALGWVLVAGSAVAFVDGAVCRDQIGRGEWNHWGYLPILLTLGVLLLGVLDRV